MDPVTLEAIRRGGQIALALYRARKSKAFRWLKSGCLLLTVLMLLVFAFFAAGIPTILGVYVVPAAELSKLENIPEGMHNANLHWRGTGGPVPRNVVLTAELEAFAREVGLYDESAIDPYYQVKGCIAAADYMGFSRSQLCALMHLEGGWPYPELASRNFTTAVSVARGLLMLRDEAIEDGFDAEGSEVRWVTVDAMGVRCEEEKLQCVEPVHRECDNATCQVYLTYFDGEETLVELLDTLSGPWEIAWTAQIEDYQGDWPVLHYWTLVNLGLDDAFILGSHGVGVTIVDGIPIVLEPGIPPPNELPDIPDGMFVHPVPGGYVSGNPFSASHPGTDYSRSPTGWAVAAHNGEVVFIGWDADGYGNYVTLKGEFPDGSSVCTLYAHGRTRTPEIVGDELRAGDAILEIGTTGKSTGPHLHFEIRFNCSTATRGDPEAILPPQ